MIWIRIVSKGGAPASSLGLGVPLAASFGDSVGDIGRGVGCTLVLPDPNREISRKQALVTSQAGRHFIRAIGANLDIELNGRPLAPDVEMPLDIGAELRVGPYVMRVEPGVAENATPAVRPSPSPGKVPPPRAADPPGKPALYDDALKAPLVEPRPLEPISRAKDGGRAPVAPPQQGVPRRPEPKDVAPESAPRPAPPRADRPAPPPAQPARAERLPDDSAKPRPRPPPPGADRADKADSGAAANDDYVGALYGGLGMAAPPPHERSADKFRLVGELLRESLAGTVELLAARQITKKNLGASPTMLQTRGNNPLKFSPNVDAALTHLLGPQLRGFIAPRDAVHDAFGDLHAHQLAMLAGMRAALEAVLQRFDPVTLEARLAPKGMMEQLMPLNRRARLWETFGEQYASILREVEDDWDALFGKAFLQAYERQLAELARKPGAED